MLKSKLTVKQTDATKDKGKYVVLSATNRTNPKIGDELTEKDVNRLLTENRGFLTIDIKK